MRGTGKGRWYITMMEVDRWYVEGNNLEQDALSVSSHFCSFGLP